MLNLCQNSVLKVFKNVRKTAVQTTGSEIKHNANG